MSRVTGRISGAVPVDDIEVSGFNGNISAVDSVGINTDGKREYFVSEMPSDLVLLCAHQYAMDGAVIMFGDGGVVLKLSNSELDDLKQLISQYSVFKKLCVVNRTYEILNEDLVSNDGDLVSSDVTVSDQAYVCEEAHSSIGNKYFNT